MSKFNLTQTCARLPTIIELNSTVIMKGEATALALKAIILSYIDSESLPRKTVRDLAIKLANKIIDDIEIDNLVKIKDLDHVIVAFQYITTIINSAEIKKALKESPIHSLVENLWDFLKTITNLLMLPIDNSEEKIEAETLELKNLLKAAETKFIREVKTIAEDEIKKFVELNLLSKTEQNILNQTTIDLIYKLNKATSESIIILAEADIDKILKFQTSIFILEIFKKNILTAIEPIKKFDDNLAINIIIKNLEKVIVIATLGIDTLDDSEPLSFLAIEAASTSGDPVEATKVAVISLNDTGQIISNEIDTEPFPAVIILDHYDFSCDVSKMAGFNHEDYY